jgi:hypothetical protein
MDEAQEKSLTAAAKTIDPMGALDRGPNMYTVSLTSLGLDFVSPPDTPNLGRCPKCSQFVHTGNTG